MRREGYYGGCNGTLVVSFFVNSVLYMRDVRFIMEAAMEHWWLVRLFHVLYSGETRLMLVRGGEVLCSSLAQNRCYFPINHDYTHSFWHERR